MLSRGRFGLFFHTGGRPLAPAGAGFEGSMSASGLIEKNSVRAYVFRFALELGHCSTQSAFRICANNPT